MFPGLHGRSPRARVSFQGQDLPQRHDGAPHVHLQEGGEPALVRNHRPHGAAAVPRRQRGAAEGAEGGGRAGRAPGQRHHGDGAGEPPGQSAEVRRRGLDQLPGRHGVPDAPVGHAGALLLLRALRGRRRAVRPRALAAGRPRRAGPAPRAAPVELRAAAQGAARGFGGPLPARAVRACRLRPRAGQRHGAAAPADDPEPGGAEEVPQPLAGRHPPGGGVLRGARPPRRRGPAGRALRRQGQPDEQQAVVRVGPGGAVRVERRQPEGVPEEGRHRGLAGRGCVPARRNDRQPFVLHSLRRGLRVECDRRHPQK
mmetsp:Transcript_3850/g.11561  ORF Transcript_3850/g.11561 Transcript_3850/m.11561 type:complete len:313 (+) Transcript_3850:681-1619(+)